MRQRPWITLALLALTAACAAPSLPRVSPVLLAQTAQQATRDGWQAGAPMLTARYHMASGIIDGTLITAGGISQQLHADTEAYDPATRTWLALAPMQTPRYIPASGVISGRLYVAGGWNYGAIAETEAYEPMTNRWTALPPMPEPILGAGSAVLAGELHVLGGTRQGALLSTHYIYNPKAKKWRKEADLPFKRAAMVVAAVDDRIYCWGGWAVGADVPPTSGAVYEGKTGRWSPAPAMKTGRLLAATATSGSRIFVLGGGGDSGYLENTLLAFDTETKQWSQGPDMAAFRNGSAAAVIGKQLIAAGEGMGTEPPSLEILNLGTRLAPGAGKTTGKRIRYTKPDWLLR
jgi:N-acetylneuraminic acid mutarotase